MFEGVERVQKALEKSYGADQVSLVSAAFRWLNHHSLMAPEYGGEPVVPLSTRILLSLSLSSDAILIGGSRMEHLESNLAACEEGPLEPGQSSSEV